MLNVGPCILNFQQWFFEVISKQEEEIFRKCVRRWWVGVESVQKVNSLWSLPKRPLNSCKFHGYITKSMEHTVLLHKLIVS
jgi:hypothetical protein